MRQRQVSDLITIQADSDCVIIDDELNGSVTLEGREVRALMTLFIQEGGLLDDDESVSEGKGVDLYA